MALAVGMKRCAQKLIGGYAPYTRRISMRLTRSFTSASNYPPYKYNGASVKPSVISQNNHVDTTIWDDVPVVDNDILVLLLCML